MKNISWTTCKGDIGIRDRAVCFQVRDVWNWFSWPRLHPCCLHVPRLIVNTCMFTWSLTTVYSFQRNYQFLDPPFWMFMPASVWRSADAGIFTRQLRVTNAKLHLAGRLNSCFGYLHPTEQVLLWQNGTYWPSCIDMPWNTDQSINHKLVFWWKLNYFVYTISL